MKNTSKLKICIISVLTVILSCSIIGVSIALANSSSKGEYVGEKYAPTITVDYGEFSEENIPNAVLNTPYDLFTATAIDLFGEEIYTHTRVWLFYDSSSRSLVNVEDGEITPKSYGVYTVEFSAVDRWGNKTVLLYDFECAEKEALLGKPGTDSKSHLAGKAVKVNDLAIENAIGSTTVTVKAVLKSDSSVSYEVIDGEFTPMYAGTYDVIYTISDYNEVSECSYEVEVSAHDGIVWQKTLEIGSYYLVGCEYVMPEVKAYTFNTGAPTPVDVEIKVTGKKTEAFVLEADRKFTPDVVDDYSVVYTAKANGKTLTQTAKTKSVNVGFDSEIKVEEYLIGDGIEKSLSSNAVVLSAKKDASVRFINAVSSRLVYVELSVVKESADNFSDFDVIVTDAEDSSKSILFNYSKDGQEGGILTASGGRNTKSNQSFYYESLLDFTYNNIDRTVQLGSSSPIEVVKTVDGEEFTGFTSEKVYIDIRFNGVTAVASLNLKRINSQTLYQDCGDTVAPEIVFTRFGEGEQTVGNIVTLDRIYVWDVLCPNVEVSYYVKAPSGKFVTDVNGIELKPGNADPTKQYQFEVKEYGKYTVTMRISDMLGNSATYTYNVSSINRQTVRVELIDDQPTTGKLGDTITLKSFEVPGYDVKDLVVRVYVITPDQITKQVEENTFLADMRGSYDVWYYITDAEGNLDMVSYTITIS